MKQNARIPPLKERNSFLILFFHGFARNYLDRKKTLLSCKAFQSIL
ncbi:hypothetical protein D922_03258 [Enterococcus faecalis 06-MB-DW-09]|nr:hypothetical protein D922_03258 [Enterococcus faecalis 06-MB-DW-09]